MPGEQHELVREARRRVDSAIAGLTRSGVAEIEEATKALQAAVDALGRLTPDGCRSTQVRREVIGLKKRLLVASALHHQGEAFYSGIARLLSMGAAEYTREGVVPQAAPGAGTVTISG